MFLSFIKDYFLKKILKNNLQNVKNCNSTNLIQTIGLLIDESYFFEKDKLIQELIDNGILKNNIKVAVYRDKIKKTDVDFGSAFSSKSINWNGTITDSILNEFIAEKFDLLINYYDIEKAMLLKVTNSSNAQFKVGFSAIDKRLNHLMINTTAENYLVFAEELFRYLKILNKI